ncbi:M6 family metalloprotease domain-containing protein [candidate division KSB1 bacterium]|nr:M6 family metalloprotease domain-containing protein [candidate division KSB1 bacterium]
MIRFVILILTLLWATAMAMPPHPELVERIDRGDISPPFSLAHDAEIEARGVDAPTRIPYLDRLRDRRTLDEDFHAIAILIDFSDNTSRTAASSFDNLLFGSAQGTLPHFVSQVTYGALTVVTVNLPSALGWHRAPQSYAYYVNGQNGFGSYPRNAQKLTEDAIALVDPVVDFAPYDNDGDGYVDALFIVHAGSGAEYTGSNNQIWSHKWQTGYPQQVDGVTASVYSMEPELWANPGDMTVGVYVHELGHAAFGLPDLYDYGNDSHGLGRWSLMAGGSWNGTLGSSPAHPDAWCKIQMGVVTPTIVTGSQLGASIPAVENSATIFKLVPSGGGTQYALVENRQQTGYDASLPGSGLLIYHVDDAVAGNNNQWYPGRTNYGHYQVALEQADALWQLEQRTSSGNSGDPYPGSANNRSYNAGSNPNSRNYSDQLTGIAVQNIGNSGASMTADLYGAQPAAITLTVPNGGEAWYVGDADTIRWSASGFSGNVAIEINRNFPSGPWAAISSSATNSGWYRWGVTSGATTNARIRVRSVSYPAVRDSSDAVFTIAARTITVTAPNSAVVWLLGDSADITWTSQNLSENVSLEINRSYPSSSWSAIASNISNSGSYRWRIAGAASGTCRVRISGAAHPTIRDTSNVNFRVAARQITVSYPNTAVTVVAGDSANIQWTSAYMTGEPVRIELNRAYPVGSWELLADSTANDGSYRWGITEPLSTTARVRVRGTVHTTVGDSSNANFMIARRTITVTRPNTNLTWLTGGADTIRWTSANLAGNVRVELNRDYPGGSWEVLSASGTNSGWYRWNVSGPVTSSARVRVSAVNYPAVGDTSNSDFALVTPSVTVLAPNGGEFKLEGDSDTIRWTSTHLAENMRIELNRTFPSSTWVTLAASVPNTGTYVRTVPAGISTAARIRITAINHPSASDASDANFTIARRSITVTAPNTAVVWLVGDSASITWTSQNLPENLNLEIDRSYPYSTWTVLASNIPNTGSYRWLVALPASGTTRIRISGTAHATVRDTSNVNFRIAERAITVTAPNTAVTLMLGAASNITWSAPYLYSEFVRAELNRTYPAGEWELIADSTANDGLHSWTVTGPLTTAARIRVTGTVHANISDISNVNFAIGVRSITVTRPNGGQIWVIGRADTVRWTSTNMSGNVRVMLNRGYPAGAWETLASNAANNGSYRWVAAGALTETARIRVMSINYATVGDSSDADFAIHAGGEPLPGGGQVAGTTGTGEGIPAEYSLDQNFPNPFNASTQIRFGLPQAGLVNITVFDPLGRRVAVLVDEQRAAGIHVLTWGGDDGNRRSLASGAYLLRLTTADFSQTRRIVLMR